MKQQPALVTEAREQLRAADKQPMQAATCTIRHKGVTNELHVIGAHEFGPAWLSANMAAAEHARSRTDVSRPAMRELLALVALRVLMKLKQDGLLK